MKYLISLLICIVAIYFIFFTGSPLKNDFYFYDVIYSHIEKKYGGVITNHFYTPDGEDLNSTHSFIQILEFDDDIQKSDWSSKLTPILNRYELSPIEDQQFELAGSAVKAGIYFKTYATLIDIEGKEHMAFYVIASEEKQNEEADSQKIAVIETLKNIEFK